MILGITGAFGCGKSTVLAAFARRNWRTADADRLCHELYSEPGNAMAAALANRWGDGVLTPDRAIDRRKVGEIVFRNPTELEFLTRQLYPELRKCLQHEMELCRRDRVNGAFELPLLYEAGFEKEFDCVAAIWASPEIRHARLQAKRGFDEAEIRQREARQFSADQKLERADYALINNGSPAGLERQIDRLINLLTPGEA